MKPANARRGEGRPGLPPERELRVLAAVERRLDNHGEVARTAVELYSPSGRYPRIKSGVVFATQPLVARGCSPAPLTRTGPGSGVLWSDGSESRFDLTISTDPTSGAFGFNALLISGAMRGARAVAAPLLLAQRGLCMLGGVRSLTMGLGVVALTNAAPAGLARSSRDRAGTRWRR